jgi:hypothetical protein
MGEQPGRRVPIGVVRLHGFVTRNGRSCQLRDPAREHDAAAPSRELAHFRRIVP